MALSYTFELTPSLTVFFYKKVLINWSRELNLLVSPYTFNNVPQHLSRLKGLLKILCFIHGVLLIFTRESTRNQDFTFTCTLCSVRQIEEIYSEAFKLLCFVFCIIQEFHLVASLEVQYCTLVRPVLEYGYVNWDSFTYSTCSLVQHLSNFLL